MVSGIIGGRLGYRLIRAWAGSPPRTDNCSGEAYRGKSKLEVLLGADIWACIADRVVLDFGCGNGDQAIELAKHGARRVIGLDIRENALARGRQAAERAGVGDRCIFTTHADEKVDVVISTDAFEHFDDPAGVLAEMGRLLKPGGQILIAFGCPWFHPYGGHTFSIFPWAHLVFSERAFIQWRSEFAADGATRFCEVEGGLNGMTVRRFTSLMKASGNEIEHFEAVPIRQTRRLHNPLTREFLTSVVRCRLRAPAQDRLSAKR